MFGKWYIKTFHIPWGYNRLSEGALLPLAWLTGQGTAGCSPQGEQEPLAQLILSASGDLRANPSLDSWQKGTRWAQVAGLPCPVAIIPPHPQAPEEPAASGRQTRLPWGKVPCRGLCGASTPQEPWRPKAAGRAAPASQWAGRAWAEESPFSGAPCRHRWVGKPRSWERVEEGARRWDRAAGGEEGSARGALRQRGCSPEPPYLFAPYWLALPLI